MILEEATFFVTTFIRNDEMSLLFSEMGLCCCEVSSIRRKLPDIIFIDERIKLYHKLNFKF